MSVWAAGVWASDVWADDVWYGMGSTDVDDSEGYGGNTISATVRCFPSRIRLAGARKGKPYNIDPDLDYEE